MHKLLRKGRQWARRLRDSEPRPTNLAVESTDACNLDCPFCLYGVSGSEGSNKHTDLVRKKGYMDWELFSKIIPEADAFGITMVQLHFQGEPLLHQKLPDMIRLVKKHGMFCQFFTNGLLMTDKLADRILDAGVDRVRFSVDGATQETYQKNRVGGDFEKVRRIMRMFHEKSRGTKTIAEWQVIAMRNNEHELELAEKMAADIGIGFFWKSVATDKPHEMTIDPKYHRQPRLKPCQDIYVIYNILWNGDVVPCCRDSNGSVILGNVRENTLEEVWNSERYRRARKVINNPQLAPGEEPEICRKCTTWSDRPEWTQMQGGLKAPEAVR